MSPWPAHLQGLGLELTSEEEAREGGELLEERFSGMTLPMGTLWPGETWERSAERARGKVLLAPGPVVHEGTEREGEGAWYVDPEDPSILFLAALEEISPLLWIAVEPTAEAVSAALASLRPSEERPVLRRAWAGYMDEIQVPNVYSGELGPAEVDQLTNYWLFNPFRGGTSMAATTRVTQSIAGLELHWGEAYVWSLAYRPAPHAAAIATLNAAVVHCQYPLDMPVDLASCLLGFHYMEEPALREVFAAAEEVQDQEWGPLFALLAAVRYGAADLIEETARFAAHRSEQVRRAAAVTAYFYGFADLLVSLEDDPSEAVREVARGGVHPDAPLVWEHPIG